MISVAGGDFVAGSSIPGPAGGVYHAGQSGYQGAEAAHNAAE